jgi:hypothetical protein
MKALHEYGTPETLAISLKVLKDIAVSFGDCTELDKIEHDFLKDILEKAVSLERRLAMARDALSEIVRLGEAMPEPSQECEIAILALKGTEAK